jgi:hypothetical protein
VLRALTYALTQPETAVAAVAALHGRGESAAVEALVEVLYRPHTAPLAPLALAALDACEHLLVVGTLVHALGSPLVPVRLAAVEALARRRVFDVPDRLARLLREDGSWPVRRAALRALAAQPEPGRRHILAAEDDPHWRVRHALIQSLRHDEQALERLEALAENPRVQGVRDYLKACRTGDWTAPPEAPVVPEAPWWDPDPAVLARNLEEWGEAGREPAAMVALLGHEDERVRRLAVATLRRASTREIVAALGWLDDPRHWAGESVRELLGKLDEDRVEAAALHILDDSSMSPVSRAWAMEQLREPDTGASDGREAPALPATHPIARAALTPERARELLAHPERETSWHVLHTAARMCKVPLWHLEPKPAWEPPAVEGTPAAPLTIHPGMPPHARPIGPARLLVSRIGISGHYGLPVEGFVRAVEAGVNLLFWEPGYQTLTGFDGRLPASLRGSLHFVAGTFEATAERVRKDVERALRVLQIEQLRIFLLFWTRSWSRVTDELRRLLERLRDEGKVAMPGLSTHNRTLAVEAINGGWDPVMVRHSAAHRGAEQQVFPLAASLGRGLLTFNSLCYGRLLQPRGDRPAPTAADCYRYTLSQPGVAVCLSAPATLEQLAENLDVLRDPELPEERRQALLEHGDDMYREETLFRRVVRSR